MLQQQDRWIWPFELTEKIGEGGMGVVYKARYVVNDRPVAVKLVPNDVTDETVLARFEREVEILKTLRHPNIVLCFGGVCEDKRRFYAMEYVDGGTLDDLLQKRGRLPWEMVVEYAKQMCAALAYAHERGILHRDLKPANFLITGDGRLKLSDFGLATLIAGRKITAAGRTAGTYEYMSPEQISGKEMSPRADLYSLGCVLFELLTGHPPFHGANSAEILHQHLKARAPHVAAQATDCPAGLDRLLANLLEKIPDDRPATAVEVANILRSLSAPVRVEGGAPSTGVSNRPTTLHKPRVEEPEPPPSQSAAIARSLPLWIPAVLVAVFGLLLTRLSALGEHNEHLSTAESAWLTAFDDPDPSVRDRAAVALGDLGRRSPEALNALAQGLESQNPFTRGVAAKGMGHCGDAARPHLSTLVRLARDDLDSTVRQNATKSTEEIRRSAPAKSGWPWVLTATLLAEAGILVVWWRGRKPNAA
jgi:eukaryotic-like serine/threonine-protein kinase